MFQTQSRELTQVQVPMLGSMQNPEGNLEPQQMTAKPPTSAWVYTSSRRVPVGGDRANYVFESDGAILIQKASRVKCVGVSCSNFFIPNVNPRNNTLSIYSTVSGTTHSVVLDEAYYAKAYDLATHIVNKLNLIVGATGLTFSLLPASTYYPPNTLEISSVGGSFYFVPTCTAVEKGQTVYGIPINTVSATSQIIGPMLLTYTPYVDVYSSALTKYAKIRSLTANGRANLFVRAFQGKKGFISVSADPGDPYFQSFDVPNYGSLSDDNPALSQLSFAFRPREVLTAIDFQLFDSSGDPLYIPPYLADTFDFRITVQYEI